jgi:hypothetical protein
MRIYCHVLLILILLISCSSKALSQQSAISLKDKKVTIHREKASLRAIFEDLIEKFDVAIGFEQSSLDNHQNYWFEVNTYYFDPICATWLGETQTVCRKHDFESKKNNFTVNVDDQPLEIVLNQLVSEMKYYKWEINDGVVNIIPNIGRESILEELLKVNIKNYSIKKIIYPREGKSIGDIKPNIVYNEDFEQFRKTHALSCNLGSSTRNPGRPLPGDYEFSNLTLKELLNKITAKKRGGWSLRLSRVARFTTVELDI